MDVLVFEDEGVFAGMCFGGIRKKRNDIGRGGEVDGSRDVD